MIITPHTKFYAINPDDKEPTELAIASVVDDRGLTLEFLAAADTAKGVGQQYLMGANGQPVLSPIGEQPITCKIEFQQLYLVLTPGPSEQVVQRILTDAAVPQGGN